MALPGDAIVAVVALIVGYLVGSVPVSAFVGQAAGVDPGTTGEPGADARAVWRRAGPGAGLLALAGDLAKGVIPVALGLVTWSWGIGWVAGLGALLGACWPLFGRLPGGLGLATLAGVVVALAPPVGLVAVLLAIVALAIARLLGRDGLVAAIVTGFASSAVLLLASQAVPAQSAAVAALFLVVALRRVTTRR